MSYVTFPAAIIQGPGRLADTCTVTVAVTRSGARIVVSLGENALGFFLLLLGFDPLLLFAFPPLWFGLRGESTTFYNVPSVGRVVLLALLPLRLYQRNLLDDGILRSMLCLCRQSLPSRHLRGMGTVSSRRLRHLGSFLR